jgi:microcystin-dependent protein
MVNSFTTGKGRLILPAYGAFVDEWNRPCNSDFGLVDALISGTTTLNVSTLTPSSPFFTLVFQDFDTSQTPWLNPLAGQNMRVAITGALSFNVTIFIPANFPGMWIFDNQTTGPFTVTVVTNAAGSTGINPSQGYMSLVFCDGTNVKYADLGNIVANTQTIELPSGAIFPFGGANPPAGYLPCNGAAVSRTTYSRLFSAIGTLWGVGDGSTTFNVPDLQNMFIRGAGSSPVGTFEANTFGTHTHTVTDPGHTHSYTRTDQSVQNVGYFPGGPIGLAAPVLNQTTGSSTTGITIANAGGSETRPDNKRVLFMVKT